MSNMSYCRFQNTLRDLRDCLEALENEGLPESLEEQRAAKSMRRVCEDFVEAYANVEDSDQ